MPHYRVLPHGEFNGKIPEPQPDLTGQMTQPTLSQHGKTTVSQLLGSKKGIWHVKKTTAQLPQVF